MRWSAATLSTLSRILGTLSPETGWVCTGFVIDGAGVRLRYEKPDEFGDPGDEHDDK